MKQAEGILKKIISSQGLDYISRQPFEVYQSLLREGEEPSYARLVLLTILAGDNEKALKKSEDALSAEIQKDCYLKKAMADKLASMYADLYSKENLAMWKKKAGSGFRDFCRREWKYEWDTSKEWHKDGGYVECTCEVTAKLKVSDQKKLKQSLHALLELNPFITQEGIEDYLRENLDSLLDYDVEEYVNGDDYYEPWMPDYDCEDVLKKFCSQNGLALVDYTCDGDTSDWQSERW